MARLRQILDGWMLPAAIVLGIGAYLGYYFTEPLHQYGHILGAMASHGQRLVIATLLFFQFVKVSPHDLVLRRWHLAALLFQTLGFLVCAFILMLGVPDSIAVLLECAMICIVCPTASAAGVITEKLGGNLAGTVTYVVLINVAATLLIPLVIPLVSPSATLGFWAYVGHLALRVIPVLILPCLAAWIIRYTMPVLRRRLVRWSVCSFYVWGVGLFLAMVMSSKALLMSHLGWEVIAGVVAVSLLACVLQFAAGRRIGAASFDKLTAGQALGQKNTGFLIWLGYSYLTPVTSVAGGLYAVWQNLFNSWELRRHSHARLDRASHFPTRK